MRLRDIMEVQVVAKAFKMTTRTLGPYMGFDRSSIYYIWNKDYTPTKRYDEGVQKLREESERIKEKELQQAKEEYQKKIEQAEEDYKNRCIILQTISMSDQRNNSVKGPLKKKNK